MVAHVRLAQRTADRRGVIVVGPGAVEFAECGDRLQRQVVGQLPVHGQVGAPDFRLRAGAEALVRALQAHGAEIGVADIRVGRHKGIIVRNKRAVRIGRSRNARSHQCARRRGIHAQQRDGCGLRVVHGTVGGQVDFEIVRRQPAQCHAATTVIRTALMPGDAIIFGGGGRDS